MSAHHAIIKNCILACALVTSVLFSALSAQENELAKLDLNKSVVQHFMASPGNMYATAAQAPELLSENYTQLRAEYQNLLTNASDPALAQASESLDVAIPDRIDVIEEMVADGDIVGIVFRTKGTHLGNLYGIPATSKSIDIQGTAFFWLADGKITQSWILADEAALLKQLNLWLPERSDGKQTAPPQLLDVRDGNEVLAEIKAAPEDNQTYLNKFKVSAYKSANPPEGLLPEGRPYEIYTRSGFNHMGKRAEELGVGEQSAGQAFPDRRDQVALVIAEGDQVMIAFRLTGTNTQNFYGTPPTNARTEVWEVGLQGFEGDHWKTGWWLGDEIGMMLKIGAPQEFLIPGS
ncbi:MAG: SnoaL-like domain-containing protein [Proteobacteria bacterium]|jgi:predicted ester cyclase|nr:SnoaL-like domain-containing protein [Pseudomonadota bacterium]